jgi:hypothetical protein
MARWSGRRAGWREEAGIAFEGGGGGEGRHIATPPAAKGRRHRTCAVTLRVLLLPEAVAEIIARGLDCPNALIIACTSLIIRCSLPKQTSWNIY